LISFLTFQISMFFSASLGCSFFPDDMVATVWCVCVGRVMVVGSRDFLDLRGASDVVADWRRVYGGARTMRPYHSAFWSLVKILGERWREGEGMARQLAFCELSALLMLTTRPHNSLDSRAGCPIRYQNH
jgi:hypothetical protein